jgi:hypothetical protein
LIETKLFPEAKRSTLATEPEIFVQGSSTSLSIFATEGLIICNLLVVKIGTDEGKAWRDKCSMEQSAYL